MGCGKYVTTGSTTLSCFTIGVDACLSRDGAPKPALFKSAYVGLPVLPSEPRVVKPASATEPRIEPDVAFAPEAEPKWAVVTTPCFACCPPFSEVVLTPNVFPLNVTVRLFVADAASTLSPKLPVRTDTSALNFGAEGDTTPTNAPTLGSFWSLTSFLRAGGNIWHFRGVY